MKKKTLQYLRNSKTNSTPINTQQKKGREKVDNILIHKPQFRTQSNSKPHSSIIKQYIVYQYKNTYIVPSVDLKFHQIHQLTSINSLDGPSVIRLPCARPFFHLHLGRSRFKIPTIHDLTQFTIQGSYINQLTDEPDRRFLRQEKKKRDHLHCPRKCKFELNTSNLST